MSFWVYILQCSDNSFYVGKTTDIKRRINEHNQGFTPYTKNRKPFLLVYTKQFNIQAESIRREKEIKGWSRVKKIALIKSLR